MKKLTLTLAASLMLGGLGFTAASAAPAMPAPTVLTEGTGATEVRYHRHRGMRHHGMRHRSMRRMQRRVGSDPNSRNPSQPGFQQQKGQTSGGPRY